VQYQVDGGESPARRAGNRLIGQDSGAGKFAFADAAMAVFSALNSAEPRLTGTGISWRKPEPYVF
jgi:hypothetical protein